MSPHDDREIGLVSGGQDASTRPPATATVINYSESHLDERVYARPEDLQGFTLRPAVTWISVDGVCDGD
ncbi:MAG: magnesium and cobalt transport protein CorA, partial [Methanomicrobiales archaeon]|nr:magnesium and cobalt transport protein CorA [Methanomicrobiales archaeon]